MRKIRATVPGSIMLMGEHSVLFGEKALACAVDKYITVELEPRQDRLVLVDSALAQYESNLDDLVPHPDLSFVLSAVRHFTEKCPSGFLLRIKSEFSHKVGLGSSAAVTVGTVAVLSAFSESSLLPEHLFETSLSVVHAVQEGRGSGTDLVASVYGSIISYNVSPRKITSLQALPEISLFYAGYKTKTPDVLKLVESLSENSPAIYEDIYRLMGVVTDSAETAIKAEDWLRLGGLMNNYQGLMDALGVSDKVISDMVYRLRDSKAILGVKISGSGLGDCVLALGDDPQIDIPYEKIPVAVSKQGVNLEYL